MFDLALVGAPRLLPAPAIAAVVGDRFAVLPGEYLALMTVWGPGTLCGVFELPDPTSARFRSWQHRLRVEGSARRLAGAWGAVSDVAFTGGVVLGVDTRGIAVFARGAADVVLLHPGGHVLEIGSFEALIRRFLLGGQLVKTQRACFTEHVRASWRWDRQHTSEVHAANDLGVPANYVTEPSPLRARLLAAWAAGDEVAADAMLAQLLEREVTGYALLELLAYLASEQAAGIPPDIRATYADQLFRTARRRLPDLVPDLPIREIRIALGQGTLAAEHRESIAALLERPAGIFIGEPDATEAALLEQLATQPADAAARLVYADHLEEQGALGRAHAIRAELDVAPLLDAAERGFVSLAGFEPVDGTARVRARVETWEVEAPACSIADLLGRIDALHPTARQGYELLLAMAAGRGHWAYRNTVPGSAHLHLVREIPEAWPQLVLALRSADADAALAILVETRVRDAAPFILSCLLQPGHDAAVEPLALADGYLQLGKVTQGMCDELAPYLAPGAVVAPAHQPHGTVARLRAVAFRLLRDFGADDRVFEGALRYFCEAHPDSERVVRKRKTDPRVREVLGAQLAVEESTSLRDGGRTLAYSPALGLLARYLAKLGDAHAKELAERYKKYKRWADYSPRERDL
ncbi:MAG: TIGR02996 domain-containing protein [Myxococcota bacterium]|nr:TIGR02996 domain-containing protein [Myxococcota bacterium]